MSVLKRNFRTYCPNSHSIERVINFADKVTMLSENGAKSVIVSMDNLQELSNVPPTVLGNTDVPFYQNNQMLMQKAILLD